MAIKSNDYRHTATQAFRAAMKLGKYSYEELSDKLKEVGITQQPGSLKNKISRGNFSARFLFASLEVMQINFSINQK